MAKIEDVDIPSLLLQEGSAPSTPASTKWKVYTKTTGLFVMDDAGVETGPLVAASGAAALQSNRVIKTDGDFSTASTTYVDVTGLTITLTTGARRCLVGYSGSGYNSSGSGNVILTIAVDGADEQEVAFGAEHGTASRAFNMSATWMTATLTAASHTIKLRMRTTTGTATVNSNSSQGSQFWVAEIY